MTSPASARSTAWWLFAACALAAAALHPGVVDNVDSRIIFRTAERLVDAGTWSLGDVDGTYMASPEYGGVGPDGSHQMKFGPGTALLDVPFLLLGRLLLVPLGLDAHRAGEAGAAAASVLWFALSCVLVRRVARRVTDDRTALVAALVHGFASYAIVYGRSAYLETPLTVAVLVAYDAALASRSDPADRRAAWVLGAAFAAVVWIKLAAVVVLAGLPAILFVGRRGFRWEGFRTAWSAGLVTAAGLALWGWTNYVRFGNALTTGYSGSARFDHPLLSGLGELLVSERGGLLFFAPVALLGLCALPAMARRDRGFAVAAGLSLAAALPLYATFFSPFGGDAWGPRYLLPNTAILAVPAAAVLVRAFDAGAWRRAAAAGIVAGGVALQAAPCVVGFSETWTIVRQAGAPARLGVVAARVAVQKAVTDDGTYDRAAIGAGVGRWTPPASQSGVDVWPVRTARELPRRATVAWTAWALVAAGAAGALFVTLRRAGTRAA